MQPEDFMQISRRFHAEWVAESQRFCSGIVPESFWNPSASLAEYIWALSRLDAMQHEDFMKILRRMGRRISAESYRNRSGIVRNRSGIVLEFRRKPSRIFLGLIQAGLHAT